MTHDHEILIAIQLDTARLHGRNELLTEQVLEQIGQICARFRRPPRSGVLGALSAYQIARVVRTGFDPFRARRACAPRCGRRR